MTSLLAQTLTAQALPSTGSARLDAIIAAIIALASAVAAIERAAAAWRAGQAATDAETKAKSTKEIAVTVIKGIEDVLEALPAGHAEKARELLKQAAKDSQRFEAVREVVREVTHPEEKPQANVKDG